MKKIMAIILNYNSTEDTQRCVGWLEKQSYRNFDIVVVDNMSSGGWEKLQKFCSDREVGFIRNPENKGYSAGNNVGLRQAAAKGYDYALVINPDVEIRDREYVEKAVQILDHDEQIAALGTDIVNMSGQHQNPMYEVPFICELLWPFEVIRIRLNKNKLPYTGDHEKGGYCEKISGCCFFLRMSFAERIGFLDEKVFLYCEEPILAATIKREKKKEFYCADLTAYHMHRESEKGDQRKRMATFYDSRVYYLKNYSGYKGMALKLLLLSRVAHKYYFTHR